MQPGTGAQAAMMACAVRLGTQMESESSDGIAPPFFAYLLTPSATELGRSGFDGEPRILDREHRSFLSMGLRNFLDQVGEVYSSPQVGWNFP